MALFLRKGVVTQSFFYSFNAILCVIATSYVAHLSVRRKVIAE